MVKGYQYQSDFAKKHYAEGFAQGICQVRAQNVLTAFRVRGIAVPDATRERILAETDPARLERWLERAVVASSLGEVIEGLS